jgi:two-component system chemotaxis response regulator CheB
MPGHDIIVVGASAGGVEALRTLAGGLPADLPAAVFVVLHLPAQAPSMLPVILARSGPLETLHPADHEPIIPGRIYVAPPDCHLLVERDRARVVRGPKENRHRPAVDPLFRSAARAYGPRVIGVILSGTLDDGTAGLLAVKQRGGIAVVQDPDEALYPGMPRSALENVPADHIVPVAAIGGLLGELARAPAPAEAAYPVPAYMELEAKVAEMETGTVHPNEIPGTPSVYTCPECHGTLWELQEGELIRFRCRVGHAFSSESMMAEQSESLETALWTALRTLEESASFSRRLAARASAHHHHRVAARFLERATDQERHAAVLRDILQSTVGGEEVA